MGNKCTDSTKPLVLPICVDVVNSNVPLLVSHESLGKMKGSIDSGDSSLTIVGRVKIKLITTPSGHLMIGGSKASEALSKIGKYTAESIFALEIRLPLRTLCLGDLKRIHLQLGRCSENTLRSVSKAAQMNGGNEVIQKLFFDCKCQVAVQRIAPPTVAWRLGKYNGEIAALDIIFPFADCMAEKVSKDFAALFMIDSLSRFINCTSRFINCTLLIALDAEHVGQTFLIDWVRTIGKPRRIITDAGGPNLTGDFRMELSHMYGWQMIQAPQFTPQQNGLAERAVRSFKIAV